MSISDEPQETRYDSFPIETTWRIWTAQVLCMSLGAYVGFRLNWTSDAVLPLVFLTGSAGYFGGIAWHTSEGARRAAMPTWFIVVLIGQSVVNIVASLTSVIVFWLVW